MLFEKFYRSLIHVESSDDFLVEAGKDENIVKVIDYSINISFACSIVMGILYHLSG